MPTEPIFIGGASSNICIDFYEGEFRVLAVDKKSNTRWSFLTGGKRENIDGYDESFLETLLRETKEEGRLIFCKEEIFHALTVYKKYAQKSYEHHFFIGCLGNKEFQEKYTDEVGPPFWLSLNDVILGKTKLNPFHVRDLIRSMEVFFRAIKEGREHPLVQSFMSMAEANKDFRHKLQSLTELVSEEVCYL